VSHIGLGESHRPALDRIPRAGHGHFLSGHPVVTVEVGPLDPAMREQVEGIGVPELDSWPTRNLLDIGPAHALRRLLLVVEVGAAREKSESERQRKAKLVHTNLDGPRDGEVPSLARRRPPASVARERLRACGRAAAR
jgi:hypothetical protein